MTGLVRSRHSAAELERLNIAPLVCDLSQPVAIALSSADADLFYFLPPPKTGTRDSHLRHFLQALEENGVPRRIVLISTTGVYGDCRGEWVDEQRQVDPQVDRARRRWDAEQQLQQWRQRTGGEGVILRVAGIYGPGKLPLKRLRSGAPMVAETLAPWTNRIHVDDLVQVCIAAMQKGGDGEIYNVSDGRPGNMADYFNQVADRAGLPRPPVVDAQESGAALSPGLRSYLAESRRIDNRKMLRELGVALQYSTLAQGLDACFAAGGGIMNASNP